MSKSRGVAYFLNTVTGETQWERPSEAAKADTGKVRASHIVIKHAGSRRPSSWKEETITRTKDEAIAILKDLRKRIADDGEDFATIAGTESDCGSYVKGGDLGFFGKGQMQKPFEDAVYALQVGDLSDVVDTDSGVHIILRTA